MIPELKNLQDPRYAEYLKTFGILKKTKFLTDVQAGEVSKTINMTYSKAWRMDWNEIYSSKKSGALEPLTKYIQNYIEFGEQIGILKIARKLIGENCFFCGSDASMFWRGSLLHSDNQVMLPQIKFAIYLQDSDNYGNGEFFYVPGTHHSGSIYTDYAYRYCKWPRGGGLTQYNIGLEEGGEIVPPMINIKISAGDLLIFDSRMLHGSRQVNSVAHHRKMITWVFSAHPDDMPDIYFDRLGITKEETINEMNKLNEIVICKNGPLYKEEIFKSESIKQYANMFYPTSELNKKYENIIKNPLSEENIAFFMKNRIKI